MAVLRLASVIEKFISTEFAATNELFAGVKDEKSIDEAAKTTKMETKENSRPTTISPSFLLCIVVNGLIKHYYDL